ncbi:MAG TPA: hypothetical protein VM557_06390 [Thermoanaerobaculia bacterium]|nr:hypothetical protein [Thermoanaerobaculia bacterium]
MAKPRPSVTKRQREQVKREKKQLKAEKRLQRKTEQSDESEFIAFEDQFHELETDETASSRLPNS